MSMYRRFAILRCEDAPKWDANRFRWRDLLSAPGEQWDLFDVCGGELPDAVADYTGYVVTGSHYSCNDESQTWLGPLFQFLRECVDADVPGGRVAACCFGQQAVARALGGEVGDNPVGHFVIGREELTLHDDARSAFVGTTSLALLESHAECVLGLPDGAEVWAESATAPYEVFTVNERVLAFQGHPELTPQEVEDKILGFLLADGRLEGEQGERARGTMRHPLDSRRFLGVLRSFLCG